jgi:hypothetical protein
MGRRLLIERASRDLAQDAEPDVVRHPVFGCPLLGPVRSGEEE